MANQVEQPIKAEDQDIPKDIVNKSEPIEFSGLHSRFPKAYIKLFTKTKHELKRLSQDLLIQEAIEKGTALEYSYLQLRILFSIMKEIGCYDYKEKLENEPMHYKFNEYKLFKFFGFKERPPLNVRIEWLSALYGLSTPRLLPIYKDDNITYSKGKIIIVTGIERLDNYIKIVSSIEIIVNPDFLNLFNGQWLNFPEDLLDKYRDTKKYLSGKNRVNLTITDIKYLFWLLSNSYHHQLISFENLAEKIGIDLDRYKKARNTHKVLNRIKQFNKIAQNLGIIDTFFIDRNIIIRKNKKWFSVNMCNRKLKPRKIKIGKSQYAEWGSPSTQNGEVRVAG